MSDSSDAASGPDAASVLDYVERYYHVVVVAVLLAFMFWNRIRTMNRFVQDGEVLFRGNDPWYHYRQVSYTVENWPATMPFDPWTYFPNGNASGQFGTLFDQIIATVALIVGLGNPDEGTVAMVTLVAPVGFALLTAIPAYYIGKRLGGRFGGVVAVTVLALSSGEFLTRSVVGFPDHHVAEALFMPLAILAVMVALSVAARDKPIYEQVRARDIGPLRSSLGWAALAGLAVTLYLWVWPFGALLLGILGVFFVLQITIEFLRGESPEHTAFVGAVALSVTGVTALSSMNVSSFTPSELSLLQPVFAFAVVAACAFLAWLARTWEQRGFSPVGYGLTVLATGVVAILAMMLLLPGLYETFANNVVRVFGFWIDPSETGRTVAEVQPIYPNFGELFDIYGFAVIVAALAALWIVGRTVLGRDVPAEHVLVVVWAVFIAMAALTQTRFEYYLVVPVGVLCGYAIGGVFGWLDLQFDPHDVEVYEVVSVVAVVLVLVLPLVIGPSTAVAAASGNGPSGDIQAWSNSLDWMEENTPEEGLYADDEADLEFYGTYERTDDFDYDPGAYGVMSWWDYGHWITQQGERIPHANPHQQGSNTAANFLLAPSEGAANDVLQGIDESEQAQNRYVMVDWKMANTHTSQTFIFQNQRWGNLPNGKFFAPIQFYDAGTIQPSDYFGTLYYESPQYGVGTFNYHKQDYYESQVTRLYRFHGSAVEPEPIVLDWDVGQLQGQQVPMTDPAAEEPTLKSFDTMEEARAYVENDTYSQIGGVGSLPSERVPALEHYRLVSSSDNHASQATDYQLVQASTEVGVGLDPTQQSLNQYASAQWTKVFERVPGAQIEGSIGENATVQAAVEMYDPAANQTFTYQQQTTTEDGEFSMTLPYSTEGYDQWGPEDGRTNVSVRATGDYQLVATSSDGSTAWTGNASVPESAVIGESEEPVQVDLSEAETAPGNETGAGEGTGSEQGTDGAPTDGNGSDDGAPTDGTESEGSGTTNDSESQIAGASDVVTRDVDVAADPASVTALVR